VEERNDRVLCVACVLLCCPVFQSYGAGGDQVLCSRVLVLFLFLHYRWSYRARACVCLSARLRFADLIITCVCLSVLSVWFAFVRLPDLIICRQISRCIPRSGPCLNRH
jgi:hypothetical protein